MFAQRLGRAAVLTLSPSPTPSLQRPVQWERAEADWLYGDSLPSRLPGLVHSLGRNPGPECSRRASIDRRSSTGPCRPGAAEPLLSAGSGVARQDKVARRQVQRVIISIRRAISTAVATEFVSARPADRSIKVRLRDLMSMQSTHHASNPRSCLSAPVCACLTGLAGWLARGADVEDPLERATAAERLILVSIRMSSPERHVAAGAYVKKMRRDPARLDLIECGSHQCGAHDQVPAAERARASDRGPVTNQIGAAVGNICPLARCCDPADTAATSYTHVAIFHCRPARQQPPTEWLESRSRTGSGARPRGARQSYKLTSAAILVRRCLARGDERRATNDVRELNGAIKRPTRRELDRIARGDV